MYLVDGVVVVVAFLFAFRIRDLVIFVFFLTWCRLELISKHDPLSAAAT